ncbi:MAG: alcohol dehydrogenase catalytic domain-containing protein [bacterium]
MLKKEMLGAVFEEGKLVLKNVIFPTIKKENEVLLKIELASICNTDINILEKPSNYLAIPEIILGHEYIGSILEVGKNVHDFKIGQKVVVNPSISCLFCKYCQNNLPHFCENLSYLGISVDGGLAEYSVVPSSTLYSIPDDLNSEIAIFTESLSYVMNALEKIKILPDFNVVVLGTGLIGLICIKLLKTFNPKMIIASEINKYRRNFALKCGADFVINPIEENLEKVVLEKTKIGAHIVIDTVGSLLKFAFKLVQVQGKIILLGENKQTKTEIFQNKITSSEITIYGSTSSQSYSSTLNFLQKNIINLENLITHKLPLSKIHAGLNLLKTGEAIKVLIYPNEIS